MTTTTKPFRQKRERKEKKRKEKKRGLHFLHPKDKH
jgi:hypothetical protein